MKNNNLTNIAKIAKINLSEINTLRTSITDGNKANFTNSLGLAKACHTFKTNAKTPEFKELLKTEKLTMDAVILQIFGVNKAWFYKLAQVGAMPKKTINAFIKQVERQAKQGDIVSLSVANLIKYASAVEEKKEGKGEEGETEEGETKVDVKEETICTFVFKGESGNVALRMNEKLEVTTSNSKKDILAAINVLSKALKSVK